MNVFLFVVLIVRCLYDINLEFFMTLFFGFIFMLVLILVLRLGVSFGFGGGLLFLMWGSWMSSCS